MTEAEPEIRTDRWLWDLADQDIHRFRRVFEDHPSVSLDHRNGLHSEVEPAHVQSPTELPPFPADGFSESRALGGAQFVLGSTILAVAARDEGQDAQLSHFVLETELGYPVDHPAVACNHRGLDRGVNTRGEEPAQVARGAIEGLPADNAVMVLAVAV